MKKLILSTLTMLLASVIFGQVSNSGFEDWTEFTSFAHPDVSPAEFNSINDEIFYQSGLTGLYEVEGVTGSAVHVETMTFLSDGEFPDTTGGYGIIGSPPNGEGEDLIFENGFPFSDMSVTNINLDMNYDINPLSPGFIIVQFLANGVPVTGGPNDDGTYIFQFSGTQTEWMSFTFDFLPGLTQIPDECVIAFASNDLLNDESPAFVGDFLEIDNMVFEGSAETIPGGDFDTWIDQPSTFIANDWDTYLPPSFNFINQSEDSYEGDFSIALETLLLFEDTVQSMIYQAEFSETGIVANQPLEAGSFALNFQYQYIGNEGEYGTVILILSEDEDPESENVAFYYEPLVPTEDWTEYTIDYSDVLPDAQYYALIFFSGGGFDMSGQANTVLMLDEVEFLTTEEECEFVPTIIEGNVTLCPEETLILTTQDYDEYHWYASEEGEGYEEFNDESSIIEEDAESGVYEIYLEATLDGCTATSEVITLIVHEIDDPLLSENEIDLCEGESFIFEIENDDEFASFQWYYSNNDEPVEGETGASFTATAGNTSSVSYYVDVTTEVCPDYVVSSEEISVNSHSIPSPTVNQNDHILSVSNSFATYQWFFNGTAISGATSFQYEATENGDYYVEVISSFGCVGVSNDHLFSDVSISETTNNFTFNMYPNPASNDLFIEVDSNKKLTIEIYNLVGSSVLITKLEPSSQNKIDVSSLSNGSYLIKINDGEYTMTQSLIVAK